MKNLLCTIMLITIPCFCYCQTKVNGLGVFQIGLPLVEFSTIITPIYGTPKHIKDEDTYYKVTEGHVYIVDSLEYVSHVIPKYDLCENIILYYFPKLNIGNNSFEKVTIEFYHDSLNKICIEGKTTELENAIEAVYGKGTVVFHEPEIACVYQLTGANFKKKGFDSKTTYRNDKKIYCYSFFNRAVTSDCEDFTYSFFLIENKTTRFTINRCNEVTEKAIYQNKRKMLLEINKERYKGL